MRGARTILVFAAFCLAPATAVWAQCSAPSAGYTYVTVADPETGSTTNVGIWYPTSDTPSAYPYSSVIPISGSVAFKGTVSTCAKYPLVVFSHADGGCGTQIVNFTEQAAREGFIVAAPDSIDATCSVTGTPYPDPVEATGFFNPGSWTDQTEINRLHDLENTVTFLQNSPEFSGSIDFTNVFLAGHSLGGYTVFGTIGGWASWLQEWGNKGEPAVKAAVLFSPYIQAFEYQDPSTVPGPTIPVMFQGGTLDSGITPWIMGAAPPMNGYAQSNGEEKFFMELPNATHFAWTTSVCGSGPTTVAECLGTSPNAQQINNYAFAFLKDMISQTQTGGTLWSPPVADTVANYWRDSKSASVSDASFSGTEPLAGAEAAALFSAGLSLTTASDGGAPYGIGTVKVTVTDSLGVSRLAQVYFISPTQINFVVPPATANGAATVNVSDSSGVVTSSGNVVATGTINVVQAAPSLFQEPGGSAAAELFVTSSAGVTTWSYVFQCISSGTCPPTPLSLGAAGSTAFLAIYGTGLRFATNLTVNVGGQVLTPFFVGPSSYPGLDQVNVIIPPSFSTMGTVSITVTGGGYTSNPVSVSFQ